jgi:glycosyltransferase involved in cell wall biosynthesis
MLGTHPPRSTGSSNTRCARDGSDLVNPMRLIPPATVAAVRERLVQMPAPRRAFFVGALAKAIWYRTAGDEFGAADATLRYSRILSAAVPPAPTRPSLERRHARLVARCRSASPGNPLLTSYATGTEAARYRREFHQYGREYARALKYPRTPERPEREGDLVLLKPCLGPSERGVLLVQYNDAIRKFAALYDLPRLAERYRFVLEPSTWGYEEATFLMYLGLPTDVIVEAQFERDFAYIRGLGGNLHPTTIGAGDWVDPDLFDGRPDTVKRYDIIMVASWLSLKRHDLLFRALAPIAHRIGRVALVGYPSGGRTVDDVRDEARRANVLDLLDIHESVAPRAVAQLLRQSRVAVMLTRREGASRAIYEALFSDTPVVVSADNIGVNRAHVNPQTGVFATDAALTDTLWRVLEDTTSFSPRAWALQHTGYRNSTRQLERMVRDLAAARGEAWTAGLFPKMNRPNAVYADDATRAAARPHYAALEDYLRPV